MKEKNEMGEEGCMCVVGEKKKERQEGTWVLSLSLCAAPDLDPTRGLTRSVRSSDSVTTDDITDGGRHRGFGWRWGRENCEHELESLVKDEARRHGEAWRGTAKLGPREPRARARISDEGRSDEARRSLARRCAAR
uniref:Uncharacterized protein n=1 Tax=Fagus sylvatica TaxID=28930 RepID=A0A2N9GGN4_FAGSY